MKKVGVLNEMVKGWFVGDFTPSVFKTSEFEVGVKKYLKGDAEESHYHKEADEYTVVIVGKVQMNNLIFTEGDIIEVKRNEVTNFICIEDTITAVVKTKSVKNDKYIAEHG
jgi:quercetin dioxygenase-like cupin family protein